MSREWELGDVAVIDGKRHLGRGIIAVRVRAGTIVLGPQEDCWLVLTDHAGNPRGDGGLIRDENVVEARPLVVLDPESDEDVQRAHDAFTGWQDRVPYEPKTGDLNQVTAVQAALRELANPTPPIEEPTRLYAVVLDRDDNQWCHIGECVWRSLTSTGPYVVEKHWHDTGSPLAVNVVRVLSEGVVPS